MSVIGFNFISISGILEEVKEGGKEINVSSSPRIDSMEKKEVEIPGMDNVLGIKFTFQTIYEPKIGGIEMTGEILYKAEDAKVALKLWKEKKTVEQKIYLEVANTILRKCLSKAVMLADDLRLPQPVVFPIVTPSQPEEKKK